jgi:autotransporter-associated beta strand protein
LNQKIEFFDEVAKYALPPASVSPTLIGRFSQPAMKATPCIPYRLSNWIGIMLIACTLLHAPRSSAELLVELDSNAGITISGTTSFTWADQAAAGGNMTFLGNSATRSPTLVEEGTPTGLPLVSFNGGIATSPNQLTSENASSLNGGPSLTWSLVVKPTVFSDIDTYLQTAVVDRPYAWTTNHVTGNFTGQVRNTPGTQFNSRIASTPLGTLANDWMILSTVYDSSAGTVQLFLTDATGMRHDGNLVTGAALANGNHLLTSLGADVNRVHGAPMDMGALRIYNEALSASQRTAMEGTLFDTYINPDYYWKSGIDSSWAATSGNLTNWTSDFEGDDIRSMLPSATSNVFFSANGVTTPSVSLAANQTIRSITFNGTGDFAILGAHTLTVEAASASAISVLSESGTITLESALAGPGAGLLKSGNSTLVLEAAGSFGGPVSINAGTLALAGADFLASSANVTIDAPGTLQFLSGNQSIGSIAGSGTIDLGLFTLTTGTFNSTFSGTIAGVGGLNKSGAGTLILDGTGDFYGQTNILGGTLVIASANALRADAVVNLESGATLTLDQETVVGSFDNNGGTLNGSGSLVTALVLTESGTLAAVIADGTSPVYAAGIRKTTSGTTTIDAANTFTGLVRIEGGTLVFGTNGSFSAASSLLTDPGATMALSNKSQTFSAVNGSGGTIALGSGNLTIDGSAASTTAASITGTGGLTKNGSSALTLSGSSSYSGGTIINAGNLTLAHASAAGSGAITLSNASSTLTIDAAGIVANSITSPAITALQSATLSGAVTANATAFFVDSGDTLTVSGSVGGSGSISKNGAGTLALSGANTFSGGTTLSGGTVRLDHASGLGSSGTIAFSGGWLQFGSGITTDLSPRVSSATSQAFNIDTGANSVTFASTLAGAGNTLTKNGTGTLTLSGANSFTGATTINAGNLTLNGGTALSDSASLTLANTAGTILHIAASETIGNLLGGGATGGNVSIASGQTLTLNQTTDVSFAGRIIGSGALTKNGTGTFTLTAANSYTGTTTVNAGNLTLGVANALSDSSNIVLANTGGAIIHVGFSDTVGGLNGGGASGGNISIASGVTLTSSYNTSTFTFAGSLIGPGHFTKAGSGNLTLSGANTHTGNISITGGNLTLSGGSAASDTGNVTLSNTAGVVLHIAASETIGNLLGGGATGGNVSIASGQTLTLNQTTSATFAGLVIGAGSLTKNGSGALTLSGANTYTGATTINAGSLVLGAGNVLADGTAVIVNSGGTLSANSRTDTVASLTITGGSLTSTSGTLTAAGASSFSNGGSIGFSGATSGRLNVNGALTLGNFTLFYNHTASASDLNGLNLGANVTVSDAATVNYTNNSTGNRGRIELNGNREFSVGTGASMNVDWVVDQFGATSSLTKCGAGTLTLNATNTYAGATTINGGTLVLNGSNTGSAITVNSGGTLGGSGTGGSLVVNSGGTINPGNSPGTLTVGDTTWNGGGNYNWQIHNATSTAGTGWDLLSSSGTLTIGASSGDKFNINLWSLSSITPDTNGTALNFSASGNYSWTLASFASVSGFSADKFAINTSANNGAGGFSGATGDFTLALSGGNITLSYTAPPPPDPDYDVQVFFDAGGTVVPYLADPSGTGENGLTVRVGSFVSATNDEVSALGYNLAWVGEQFTEFGSDVTTTASGQAGTSSNEESYNITDYNLAGERLWILFSNNGTITSSTTYGLATSTNGSWTLPSAPSTAILELNSSQLTSSAFGTFNGTSSTSSVRTEAVPAQYLYWDSNGAAGLGGTGTWSGNVSQLGWTTNSSGLAASGAYAWGSTSGNITAGAGLTPNFAGTAGTVTVSGTVQVHNGLRFETDGYSVTGGTISLAGASSANNTIAITTGSTTINSTLSGSTGLTKSGSGTLRLGGSNTYTGGTTLSTGTLRITSSGALGSGSLTQSDATSVFTIDTTGTISNTMSLYNVLALQSATLSGAITINNATFDVESGDTLTISGGVGGTGGVTQNGTGTLILSGSNTYSPPTTASTAKTSRSRAQASARRASSSAAPTTAPPVPSLSMKTPSSISAKAASSSTSAPSSASKATASRSTTGQELPTPTEATATTPTNFTSTAPSPRATSTASVSTAAWTTRVS